MSATVEKSLSTSKDGYVLNLDILSIQLQSSPTKERDSNSESIVLQCPSHHARKVSFQDID